MSSQIVTQLELQLNKERDKLDAMMAHLRLDSRNGELVPRSVILLNHTPTNNRRRSIGSGPCLATATSPNLTLPSCFRSSFERGRHSRSPSPKRFKRDPGRSVNLGP